MGYVLQMAFLRISNSVCIDANHSEKPPACGVVTKWCVCVCAREIARERERVTKEQERITGTWSVRGAGGEAEYANPDL